VWTGRFAGLIGVPKVSKESCFDIIETRLGPLGHHGSKISKRARREDTRIDRGHLKVLARVSEDFITFPSY
jgi:hypothetical protein